MATWQVTLRIVGRAELEVEAESEEEAIEKADDACCIDDLVDWEPDCGFGSHSATNLDGDDEDDDTDDDMDDN